MVVSFMFVTFGVQGFQDGQLFRSQDGSELCRNLCSVNDKVSFDSSYLGSFRPNCRFVNGVCMNQCLKIYMLGTHAGKHRLCYVFILLEYRLRLGFLCLGQTKPFANFLKSG